MSELSVRKAEKADIPTVLALYAQADFNDGRVVSVAEAEALFDTFSRYPDYAVYLAEIEGEPVGTFCLMRVDNIAHWGTPVAMVESVVVSEHHQRRGIGRLMMQEAAGLAQAKGCYKLVLSSNQNSAHAHAFYAALGFTRYGFSFKLEPPAITDKGIAA
ncbi:MAG: GNAT family N-acetyltransferase [Mesorhizobium amorphae]|nr:MAG: GNAT family N-acetyltransferase [Mesorhizobium amorphae]